LHIWGGLRPINNCRYNHYNGFYSAASDYYTHDVGVGYDYRFDLNPDYNASGIYTTEKVTSAVQAWIRSEVAIAAAPAAEPVGTATAVAASSAAAAGMSNTFAMVMHEAVHGQ
jgi:hypothetical protein